MPRLISHSALLSCAVTAVLAACSPQSAEQQDAGGTANSAVAAPPANSPQAKPDAPDASDLTVVVRGDGLLIETPGHGEPLGFGKTTPDEAVAALAALGPPKRSSNGECPAGPLDFMDWDNGLQLAFQDGKLEGWWTRENARGIATASGLHPGSPRSALGTARIEEESIGKLFTIDGVNGILDEQSGTRVAAMWGGLACIFS